MNCEDCGLPLAPGETASCASCAAEEPLFEAYARGIEVPPLSKGMWRGIAARIRRRRIVRASFAIAAALVLFAVGLAIFQRPPAPAEPAQRAAQHYRVAIARLEGDVVQRARVDERAAAAAAVLPELTDAIGDAERAVAASPSDPVAVTRLVSAYDTKLEILRGAIYVR